MIGRWGWRAVRRPTAPCGTRAVQLGRGGEPLLHQADETGQSGRQVLGWAIERTLSWLGGCRRLHRRYERKAEHFLAFVGLANALICYRRLL